MLIFRKPLSKTDKAFFKDIKSITGLAPTDVTYYKTAFTHSSACLKDSNGKYINNERLEFLGDAILNSIIGEYLFKKYPNKDEGFLTKMRSKIVSREFLDNLALEIGLDKHMTSRTNNSVKIKHIYGNCFEALVGALYLDKGYRKTKAYIVNKIIFQYVNIEELKAKETNSKSALIEWGQKNHKTIEFLTKEAADSTQHIQKFDSNVIVDGEQISSANGLSKKEAEQHAARKALRTLRS